MSTVAVAQKDLQKTIFICYPYGDYQDGNVIYVKKRVNALGAVVTYAYATSGRFRFDWKKKSCVTLAAEGNMREVIARFLSW